MEEEDDGIGDALSSGETLGSEWLIPPEPKSSAFLSSQDPLQVGKLR